MRMHQKLSWNALETELEDRINKLEDRNLEMILVEKKRELRFFLKEETQWKLLNFIRKANIRIMDIPEKEERMQVAMSLFNKIIDDNFPNLEKELDIQVHKVKRTPYYLNTKRPSLKHIILNLLRGTWLAQSIQNT